MNHQLLLIQRRDNVCTLTLNRPQKKNSLSLELVEMLGSTLKKLADNNEMRTLVLRGAGG